jgi:hypothetical protein
MDRTTLRRTRTGYQRTRWVARELTHLLAVTTVATPITSAPVPSTTATSATSATATA